MARPYGTFEVVARSILQTKFVWAKSMPMNPHQYTLRKNWRDDDDFVKAVLFIRENGYPNWYWGRKYVQMDINDRFYWTMGDPIETTILMNRKQIVKPVQYDLIAGIYDKLFDDDESREEERRVADWLGYKGGTVLDVGCGTGVLLNHVDIPPELYTGIDPSRAMLREFASRHPAYADRLVPTTMDAFVPLEYPYRYDLVVALFGSPSYLSAHEAARMASLITPLGRYFAMFYADDYMPETYKRCGFCFDHNDFVASRLAGTITRWKGYMVVEGPDQIGLFAP